MVDESEPSACCPPCEGGSGYSDDGTTINADWPTIVGTAPTVDSGVLVFAFEGSLLNAVESGPVTRSKLHAIAPDPVQADVYAIAFLANRLIKVKFGSNLGGVTIEVCGSTVATMTDPTVDSNDHLIYGEVCLDRVAQTIFVRRIGGTSTQTLSYQLTGEDMDAIEAINGEDEDWAFECDGKLWHGVDTVEDEEHPAALLNDPTWEIGNCPPCPAYHPGHGCDCPSTITATITGNTDEKFPGCPAGCGEAHNGTFTLSQAIRADGTPDCSWIGYFDLSGTACGTCYYNKMQITAGINGIFNTLGIVSIEKTGGAALEIPRCDVPGTITTTFVDGEVVVITFP